MCTKLRGAQREPYLSPVPPLDLVRRLGGAARTVFHMLRQTPQPVAKAGDGGFKITPVGVAADIPGVADTAAGFDRAVACARTREEKIKKRLAKLEANMPWLVKEYPDAADFYPESAGYANEITDNAGPEDDEWASSKFSQILIKFGHVHDFAI